MELSSILKLNIYFILNVSLENIYININTYLNQDILGILTSYLEIERTYFMKINHMLLQLNYIFLTQNYNQNFWSQ